MNTEEQVKRVRAGIKREITSYSCQVCDECAEAITNTILSNPHIGIIDDDQSLPEVDPHDWSSPSDVRIGMQIAKDANFKRLIL